MVETLSQKVGNETDKPKSNFKRYLAGSLVGGALALGTILGYKINEYVNYNGEKKEDKTVQLKNTYQLVSNNSVSDENSKKTDRKNDKKESNEDLEKKADTAVIKYSDISDKDLAKKADAAVIKYSDTFVYIYDEDSKSGELRVKLGKFSDEERAVYTSMKGTKGTKYNKEKDYISFSDKFEDKKFYKSMKDIAILSQFSKKDNISDKEKEFIQSHAPDAYDALFPFDKYDKKEIKKEKREPDGEKYKDNKFLNFIVDFYLKAKVEDEEKKIAKELEKIDIVGGLFGNKKLDNNPKEKTIKKKNLDEAPEPPIIE